MHTTVLGSTPKGTFCTCTGLKRSAVSRLAASSASFSFSFCAFSASFFFCSGVLAEEAWAWSWAICFLAWPPFFCGGAVRSVFGACKDVGLRRRRQEFGGKEKSERMYGSDSRFSCQRSTRVELEILL